MKIYALIILCICLLSMAEFTGIYPKGDFVSPVNHELKLSGTFGEIRPNHFHAGLDIRSLHQAIGDPIYAAGDGYISRIKIDEFGYGNAIYITHPNGYTTLYGHLDHFMSEIQAYVKEQQYLQKSFEVDLNPGPSKFPVTQMQQIAVMGNSGNSSGAHLHFEIRRTSDQTPVNPLYFGFELPDHTAPVIQQLMVYELDEQGELLNSHIMQPDLTSDSNYEIKQPIELAAEKVAFGLRAYDTQDADDNQNGVYSIQCKADDETSFSFSMDEIPFEKSRYVNAHIDYREKLNENLSFYRCFPLAGNKLPIYCTGPDQGQFPLNSELPRHFSISVSDFYGNASTLTFEVVKSQTMVPKVPVPIKYQALGNPNDVTIITQDGIKVVWPEGSFYESTPLNIIPTLINTGKNFSPYYELTPVDEPINTYFNIYIDGHEVPPQYEKYAFIARCQANGTIINCGGKWIGNNLTTGAREMGKYTIMLDSIPPKIIPVHFNAVMTGWEHMDFRIYDNLRIRDKGRYLIYSAYVDGEWILMSLDGKTGMLSHEFDDRIPPGVHNLQIKVTDDRGNESVLQKTFTL